MVFLSVRRFVQARWTHGKTASDSIITRKATISKDVFTVNENYKTILVFVDFVARKQPFRLTPGRNLPVPSTLHTKHRLLP